MQQAHFWCTRPWAHLCLCAHCLTASWWECKHTEQQRGAGFSPQNLGETMALWHAEGVNLSLSQHRNLYSTDQLTLEAFLFCNSFLLSFFISDWQKVKVDEKTSVSVLRNSPNPQNKFFYHCGFSLNEQYFSPMLCKQAFRPTLPRMNTWHSTSPTAETTNQSCCHSSY